MSKRERTKLVHEGDHVAEVNVELLEEPEGWAPYLSLEDAYRLDDVRKGLFVEGTFQDRICKVFTCFQSHACLCVKPQ